MKIYNDIVQGSEEWLKLRDLMLSGSKATAIASNGAGLETLVDTLMTEHITGVRKDLSRNKDIQRGNELEPIARDIYELETGSIVKEVGFIEHTKYSGVSPDGLIGDFGGWECKCPNDLNYYKSLKGEKPKPAYIWQVQMCLLVTSREWWDLTFYNPNFPQSTITTRQFPDDKQQEKLKIGIASGTEMLIEAINNYKKL